MRGMTWVVLAGVLVAGGCGGDGTPPPPDLQVIGFVVNNMPPSFANVVSFGVSDGGTAVTDATVEVTINAGSPVTIPHIAAGAYVSGGLSIGSGDNVTLTVTWNSSQIINATVQMPEQPNVTAPTGGSTHDASAAIDVVWDALSVIPTYVQLVVEGTYTQSTTDWTTLAAGSAVTASIPGGILNTGTTGIDIQVVSVNHESDLGANAEAGSYMQVAWFADLVNINTQ